VITHDESARLDPVCGMTVSVSSSHTAEYFERAYAFCSGGCRTKLVTCPPSTSMRRSFREVALIRRAIRGRIRCLRGPTRCAANRNRQSLRQSGAGAPACGMYVSAMATVRRFCELSRRYWTWCAPLSSTIGRRACTLCATLQECMMLIRTDHTLSLTAALLVGASFSAATQPCFPRQTTRPGGSVRSLRQEPQGLRRSRANWRTCTTL
jgi:YHS domain-containing protein